MLAVLGLIDVVMIANLLIMVVIGGFETFVSKLHVEGHPDQPEWLSHVNAGLLKVKLATALIGISSIHLLKTFIEMESSSHPSAAEASAGIEGFSSNIPTHVVVLQVVIHCAFIASAVFLALIDQMTFRYAEHKKEDRPAPARRDLPPIAPLKPTGSSSSSSSQSSSSSSRPSSSSSSTPSSSSSSRPSSSSSSTPSSSSNPRPSSSSGTSGTPPPSRPA